LPAVSFAILFALAFVVPASAKIGLRTHSGEIVLENVELGRTYNLREARKVPFVVTNIGTSPVEVRVDVLAPRASKISSGYEAIPDLGWLSVRPDSQTLAPDENGFFDVVLRVPSDSRFAGRHYQAELWAHTGGTGMFGAGVTGQMRFSTGPGPESLQAEKRDKDMVSLDFEMRPSEFRLRGRAGKTIAGKKSLRIVNRAAGALPLEVKVVPWSDRFRLPPGYHAAPDPGWLRVSPSELIVPAGGTADVAIAATIPEKGKYAFLLQAGVDGGTNLDAYATVFVRTQE
jgi:hypothetical protein